VVVHHFDLLRVAVLPHEADPILVVDTDAALPSSVSNESLEVIARERAQIVQPVRRVQLHQLALSNPGEAPKAPGRLTLEERLGVSIPEGPDHLPRV
jgi:hypothetical protein